MKKGFAIILVAVMLSLGACNSLRIIGFWEAEASALGIDGIDVDANATISFDYGGRGALDIISNDSHQTFDFTYKVDGSTLTVITDFGEETACEISIHGDTLVITYENIAVEYTRITD